MLDEIHILQFKRFQIIFQFPLLMVLACFCDDEGDQIFDTAKLLYDFSNELRITSIYCISYPIKNRSDVQQCCIGYCTTLQAVLFTQVELMIRVKYLLRNRTYRSRLLRDKASTMKVVRTSIQNIAMRNTTAKLNSAIIHTRKIINLKKAR
jgi:3-deoxy-D-manno-octulosonic acid (KDO) 8-phosphate synthase